MEAEQVPDVVTYHGEGPVWSERRGGLRWVDMLAGDVGWRAMAPSTGAVSEGSPPRFGRAATAERRSAWSVASRSRTPT